MNYRSITLAATIISGVAAAGSAPAATAVRNHFSHGTANCQSALPVFDTSIRKRPLALANEGSSTAFVTCDSENNEESFGGFQEVGVYFTNRGGSSGLTVSCTLVKGSFNASGYIPKSTAAIPAAGYGSITWTLADNGGVYYPAAAVSCGLPPGVDISLVNFKYIEQVGA